MTPVPIGVPARESEDQMQKADITHLGWVIAHNVLTPEEGFGGCSCSLCHSIRTEVNNVQRGEAQELCDELYGVQTTTGQLAGGKRVGP